MLLTVDMCEYVATQTLLFLLVLAFRCRVGLRCFKNGIIRSGFLLTYERYKFLEASLQPLDALGRILLVS